MKSTINFEGAIKIQVYLQVYWGAESILSIFW